ncbi:bURP domain-containing protein 16 precursor [Oryza sativa Japonica Group]|uniref:BURP domain-containing protein 16 n=2 Tax=Oryza sativa TaxID=4530 RepID=BURPG_ORYSJ|nr:bURP domain-containing protein 16 precursor [Oryza sativa Japonica Group]Q7XES5.1 RecName: Full=BURP domain-containing protein 16; Short=OsBURP16; AltName: Full=Protein WGP1; Short=OsWGP1; Flags: Precursor [Oryza sativa Japonica Group]KAB8112708.1 hypothetical protein EE612_051386 [Oryza sativa]AAP53713.1 BURP domain containing protein, expressed [Oryza sativa Japonica Group]ABR23532.1 cell wall protein WGP1 [Oryza sativa Japonica Group]EAZ16044.1 hypothetical protein OsJ_31485 [Oryza sativ|eukprot:NP_001064572.1 Os10g0409400 [Oryza sativa Japonica Group]
MATSFLFSLILLLITALSLPFPLHASSVDPLSAGATTVRYWNRKIPNNAPHPDFFLSLLSPLPASVSSSLSSPLSISPSICRSARLLCPNSTYFQSLSSTVFIDGCTFSYSCTFTYEHTNITIKPGIFFREQELKEGNVVRMPDIANELTTARSSFLPRSIADRIPFKAEAVKSLFGLEPNTTLAKAVDETVAQCQSSPSKGETKRCVTSAEDMIDFAVAMLGDDIVVRSTVLPNGPGESIMIGKVKGINGGKITSSVSCHEYLFPYMVYYCHSVPKIRVYEAEILSVQTKEKINSGVAICHIDTSAWNAGHPAFVALGGKPGQNKVCHWIFNGSMTWVIADKS